MNSEIQRIMETNTKALESLVKIALLCRKQDQTLRGHHDDKISWVEGDNTHSTEGNFVELIRFRAETILSLLNTLLSPREMHTTHPKQFEMN